MAEDQNREVYLNENLEQDNRSNKENKDRTGKQKNKGKKGSTETATSRNTGATEGYGSSQRSDSGNVGPLDADLNELPSKRRSGNNQTGPGLG